MNSLSRREEETLLKATKERALKECDELVKEFATCAKGRLVSLSWACREELQAMQLCMYEYTRPESMDLLRQEYTRLRVARAGRLSGTRQHVPSLRNKKELRMPSLVENKEFITRLEALFVSTRDSGTVWLTWKRYYYHDGKDTQVDGILCDTARYPCLLRAGNGDKNSKVSTLVNYDQLPTFHATFSVLLKGSMNTMRKRDKKRERLKAERVTAKKKKLQGPIEVRGVKRGNGRRKRQRMMKTVKKQEDTAKRQEEKSRLRVRQVLNNP